jgi:hypothetical protein
LTKRSIATSMGRERRRRAPPEPDYVRFQTQCN